MAVMPATPTRGGGGHAPAEPRAEHSIDIDDIDDVDFELADVIQPPSPPEPPTLAAGSELRRRIVDEQGVPSGLDLELIAYLLDIDAPGDASSQS